MTLQTMVNTSGYIFLKFPIGYLKHEIFLTTKLQIT